MDKNTTINTITFNELEQKIYILVCNLGCSILKTILENEDKRMMQERDKKVYRHKGIRKNCIKTLMGDLEYSRTIYLKQDEKQKKHVFLMDNILNIDTIGKISYNMAEKMIKTTVNAVSYRKAAKEIENLTNEVISHEALKNLIWEIGKTLENKEKELVVLMKKEKLEKGTREVLAIFEEADGLWINLQGKDRKEQIEKYKKQCEKKGKEYIPLNRVKTEIKLHVTHEGWKKGDKRHEVVNKTYIAGMIQPKLLKKIRDAKVYNKYNEDNIELRVMNGDGAKWIDNLKTKETILQKDHFHIKQEIIRDIKEKEHQEVLIKLFEDKKYKEIPQYIEYLKYELGGEEKTIKKLKTLKSYLESGLPRYQDILKEQGKELPSPPKDIEYRDMGIMESQIFTVLAVKLTSGRKSWCKKGANYMSKVCALYTETKGNIELEKVNTPIAVDNSVEEWIKAIEENVNKNKKSHRANRILTEEENYAQARLIEKTPVMKQLISIVEPTGLIYR